MHDDNERMRVVEIIPPDRTGGRERGGEGFSAPPTPPSPMLRTAILVAAVAGGLGILALLVAFAATVALVAVPAAIIAGGAAWLGMRWRAWRGGAAN